MASALARFQRRGNGNGLAQQPQQRKVEERVGEILSDSNSELSSIDGDADARAKQTTTTTTQPARSPSSSSGASDDSDRAARSASAQQRARSSSSSRTRHSKRETSNESSAKIRQLPARASPTLSSAADASQRPQQTSAKSARAMKKSGSRKWYSDSDSDVADHRNAASLAKDDAAAASSAKRSAKAKTARKRQGDTALSHKRSNNDDDNSSSDGSDRDATRSNAAKATAAKPAKLRTLGADANAPPNHMLSPMTSDAGTPRSLDPTAKALVKKPSGFQKLVAKTFSPFSSRRKSIESPSALASAPGTPGAPPSGGDSTASPASAAWRKEPTDAAASRLTAATRSYSGKRQMPLGATTGDVLSPQSANTSNAIARVVTTGDAPPLMNRRTSRLKQSPNGSDRSSSGPRSLDSSQDVATPRRPLDAAANGPSSSSSPGVDALSPGAQRKLPGAFVGPPGSGVLLEGWLRQKQRRGVKGMKKWNARYFVLYAKTNEVRYYADVVQSAWGPIPLGEIGSIALRLIQKIGKPSHPKYRGCRFDITCRNSWGTHYADDYVSSDGDDDDNNGENSQRTSNHAPLSGGAGDDQAAPSAKHERTATPRSSRMYSLVTDSPQTTVLWMTALDSLLVRSANSPRPDVAPSSSNSASASSALAPGSTRTKRSASTKVIARRRTSTLESETLVLAGAGDRVPKPVAFAIKYIYDSRPGIETEQFYVLEPDAAKLQVLLGVYQCVYIMYT